MISRMTAAVVLGLVTLATTPVAADDGERAAMAHVRLTTEPSRAAGCTRVGVAQDNSIRDLRRKIVRAGGNTAVISFPPDDLSRVHAEMYRCGGPPQPRTQPPPPGVPLPPSGTPPPPPAGPTR